MMLAVTDMNAADTPDARPPLRRWFGPGALVAAAVFLVGRFALEPLRDEPHYDVRGMEAFSAVETYMLRKNPTPVQIAFFGSSQSLWALLPHEIARDWGVDPALVRNLATEGGTPFDMWNLVRRNEGKFKDLRVAIVEVNPFVMKQGLDSDPRVSIDIAQHATVSERLMLTHREDRVKQMAEWVLPLLSVRRSMESAFLNVVDPDPGQPIYPCPEQRTFPAAGWNVSVTQHVKKERQTMSPVVAAKRMVGNWKCSKLQDQSLRETLSWFAKHHVRVIFHELPVHPDLMAAVHADASFEQGHKAFRDYIEALRPAPVASSFTPDPAELGITDEQMADRTHVNQLGAAIYSRHITAKVRPFLESP